MRRWTIVRALLLCALASPLGCSVARPLLFWRDPQIRGDTQLYDEKGALLSAQPAGVTLNFIQRGGRLEDTLISAQTDASGSYRSPVLPAGEYTVEALLPGYVIETQSVELRSHEHRRLDFSLKKIQETSGRSLREAQDDNIPHPGEVQILPPPF